MQLETKTLRKSINKAFLKETVDRATFNDFKAQLATLLDNLESAAEKDEHEEHLKNLLVPFLNNTTFSDYYINTSARIDLAIHTGDKVKDPVGVLLEVKRPANRNEMITESDFNRKAMHEAVLYYLQQRLENENTDLKHIVVTDTRNWFVFDAQEFERCFHKPSALRKTYESWTSDQKVSSNNDFMYEAIADFINEQDTTLRGLHLDLREYGRLLEAKENSQHEKKLIPLFKFFTPIHLLKEPFANDSNTLNKEFYRELLYILGLEEVKDGSTRYIKRAAEENRQPGTLIENTIRILDAEDHLSTVREPKVRYGKERGEQLFNVALELSITWMNRILFLKLLEAQLYRYHRQDKKFKFLNAKTIDDYDELNKLFFQVLARKEPDRPEDVNAAFGHIPYLNSSLFDPSTLEHEAVFISNLDDKKTLPVYRRSVLGDQRGEERSTLRYLFDFLDAYDFSAEGGEEIQPEWKTLINASVLGLIFEKINGYKDGSFFTPGFITEYMARETLRKAVADKFAEHWDEEEVTFTEIYNRIGRKQEDIEKANEIVNSITICDPAVGSGHFLVSCLNELLAIKSDLGILCDRDGKLFHHVNIEVENDELIVTWGDEELFDYDVSHTWQGNKLTQRKINAKRQRIQKALFHEKRHIIENCLFGVDINPNSVKICRLRLWIELLKNTYYTERSEYRELEVLPNIDINIKTGNSLVSRFDLDSDLSSVFKDSDHSLEDYKEAVRNYKQTGDRTEKQRLQQLIDDIKEEYSTTLINNRPINKKLSKARGKLEIMQNDDLFGEKKFTKKDIKKQKKKVEKLEEQKEEEESGAFYNQAFEWRFEFPEVLDEDGRFEGFDVVIGNPPYLRHKYFTEIKKYLKINYTVYHGTADLYSYFIERGISLLNNNGLFHFIVANKWMRTNYGKPLRIWLQDNISIETLYDFGDLPVFEEASTYPCLLQLRKSNQKKSFKGVEVEHLDFHGLENYLEENHNDVDQTKLQADGWILIDENSQRLLEKIKNKGITFEEYVGDKVNRGIVTGLNNAFVIDQKIKNKLIAQDSKSSEIIKPFLRGRDIKRYTQPKADEYVIFARRGIDIKKYPAVLEHLSKFREKLEPRPEDVPSSQWKGRKPGNYKWYEIQDAIDYYEDFEMPKIVYPNICIRPEFTFDGNKQYTNQKCFIISSNDKALLGILNSKIMSFFFETVLPKLRDNYYEPSYIYMKEFPIPLVKSNNYAELTTKVNRILTLKHDNPKADTSSLEEEIDRMIYKLYELSQKEIKIIDDSLK